MASVAYWRSVWHECDSTSTEPWAVCRRCGLGHDRKIHDSEYAALLHAVLIPRDPPESESRVKQKF